MAFAFLYFLINLKIILSHPTKVCIRILTGRLSSFPSPHFYKVYPLKIVTSNFVSDNIPGTRAVNMLVKTVV